MTKIQFLAGAGKEYFFFPTVTVLALGSTQHHVQCITGPLSLGGKWPVCEADHSLPPSTDVKNAWSYTSTPPIRHHDVIIK